MFSARCVTPPWRNADVTSCHGRNPIGPSNPGEKKSPIGQSAYRTTSTSPRNACRANTMTFAAMRKRVTVMSWDGRGLPRCVL